MRRYIINADDFGISDDVNEAISKCFEKGIISNTTVMVNMEAALFASNLASEKGFKDKVGLHLNLTAGVPLTQGIKGCPLFCRGDGSFNAAFHLSTASRLHLGKKERMCVRDEIEAQMNRYLALGFKEMHLDSHHHVHTDIAIFSQASELIKEYGFKTVRLGRNVFGKEKVSAFNRLYKKYLNGRIRKTAETTAWFGSLEDMLSFNGQTAAEVCEIMVHPLFSDSGDLMDTDRPISDLSDFIADVDAELISYSQLIGD